MWDELFYICVDILSILGDLTGLTYNQINVLIFCLIWPLHTIYLFTLSYRARKRLFEFNNPGIKRNRLPFIFPLLCFILRIKNN